MHRLILRLLPDLRLPWWQCYGLATAILAAMLLARWALDDDLAGYPLLLYWPTVFVVALLLDLGTGLYATAVSVIAACWFSNPPGWGLPDTPQDILALAFFVATNAGISVLTEGLRRALRAVAAAEREKDLLLKEIYHRIGNDLQRLSAVLALEAHRAGPALRPPLDATVERLRVLGWVYASLRRVEGHAVLGLRPFLEGMIRALATTHGAQGIVVRADIRDAEVSLARASDFGMILNELLTNAYKHAFPDGRAGTIRVRFRKRWGCKVLSVQDDGVGVPAAARPGHGTILVDSFVLNMGGRIKRISAGGARAVVVVPIERRR